MKLRIRLVSDSAFGRGDGIAGLVDSEVEHDARTGFPLIKGRTIKGLLVESCADLLYALQGNASLGMFEVSAEKLFGVPGSTIESIGCLHIGSGMLPSDLRTYFRTKGKSYEASQILQALTTIRQQTAVDPTTGTPLDGTLRSTRVVLRETIFYADVHSSQYLVDEDYQLLAACAAGVKRGGQNRTRGLGHLEVSLQADKENLLAAFATAIGGNV